MVILRSLHAPNLSKHFDEKLSEVREAPQQEEGNEDRAKTEKEKAACRGELLSKLHLNMDRCFAREASNIDHARMRWKRTIHVESDIRTSRVFFLVEEKNFQHIYFPLSIQT